MIADPNLVILATRMAVCVSKSVYGKKRRETVHGFCCVNHAPTVTSHKLHDGMMSWIVYELITLIINGIESYNSVRWITNS